jgi:hypothetical protein
MAIDKTLIDQLLADYKKPEDIIGENGLLKQLTKALLERALQAELTDHLGFEKHDPAGHHSGNSRNGTGRKVLKRDFGELELETPRDRQPALSRFVPPRLDRLLGIFVVRSRLHVVFVLLLLGAMRNILAQALLVIAINERILSALLSQGRLLVHFGSGF